MKQPVKERVVRGWFKIRARSAVAVAALCCVQSTWAESVVSVEGAPFQAAVLPLTVRQLDAGGARHTAATVERETVADSWVEQAGYYNRAALIQLGSDKYSFLQQQGRFNRGLVVQVGSASTDIHDSQVRQSGDGALNTVFEFQTSADPADWDAVDAAWASLDVGQAQTVAHNFIYAPEVARAQVGIAEDVALHLVGTLTQQQDRDRFAAHNPEVSPSFALLSYGQSRRDDALGAVGYRQHLRALTVGMRHPLSAQTRLGWALNVTNADAGLRQGMGSVDTQAYQLAGFGSHVQGLYHWDWMLSWGRFDFNTRRFAGAMQVNADNRGQAYAARVQGAYLVQGESGQTRWGPFVAATYSRSMSDAYHERGNVLLAQELAQQDRRRLLGSVGAVWHFDGQTAAGRALRSHVKLEWVHDTGIDSPDRAYSRFAFEPGTPVVTPLGDAGRERYGVVSAGLQLALTPQLSMVLTGQQSLGGQTWKRGSAYLGLSWAL